MSDRLITEEARESAEWVRHAAEDARRCAESRLDPGFYVEGARLNAERAREEGWKP